MGVLSCDHICICTVGRREKSQSLNDPIGLLPKFSHCKEAACCYGPLGGKGHRKKRSPDSPDGIIRKNHFIFFHIPACAINEVWNTFCSFLIEHRVDLSSSKRVGHGPIFYSTGVSTSRLCFMLEITWDWISQSGGECNLTLRFSMVSLCLTEAQPPHVIVRDQALAASVTITCQCGLCWYGVEILSVKNKLWRPLIPQGMPIAVFSWFSLPL